MIVDVDLERRGGEKKKRRNAFVSGMSCFSPADRVSVVAVLCQPYTPCAKLPPRPGGSGHAGGPDSVSGTISRAPSAASVAVPSPDE